MNARLRNAISRMADWVNGVAVKLFDLAGRIRGKAAE
jgi:hypothetical protein